MPSIYLSQVAMVAIAPLLLGSVLVTGTTSTAVALPASNIAAGPGADISESAQAVSSGQPVEVSSVTTPTQLVTALPDGSFQLQSDTVPVRVETAVGWEPVDTDLVYDSQSNTWGPRLVSASVRFSGGGRGVVAEISRESGEWLTETWNYGSLPKPTVEGPTATYHNVFPGVDLHLTATATGLSQVLEITSASAAADPRLDDFTIPVDGADLEELADGSISAVVDGEEAFVGGSPQWWDSSDKKADENEPGLTSVIRSVPQEVADSEVSLQIGDLATTPGLVFPVFVDPDWSTGAQHTWYTDRRYPTTSYLDGQNSSILRLGYNTISEVNLSRAFWEFNTAPIVGKHVLAAQFSGRKIAGQCRPTQMWRYGPVGAGFTWNQDPGAWNQHLDTQVVGQGSSCSTNATVGFNAVGGAAWAATGSNVLQLGFRAENEGDAATRTHWERGATLTVNYNSVPNAPSGASVASPVRGCGTSSAPASFHDSAGITLQTSVSDVDGGNLRTSFNVVSAATGAVAWSGQSGYQAQGVSRVTIPAQTLAAETLYRWDARADDTVDTSSPSASCYFLIDRTSPPSPTAARTGAPTNKVGWEENVQFTTSPGDRVARVGYWWAYGAPTAVPAAPVQMTVTEPARPCDSVDGTERFACTDGAGTATAVVAPVDKVSTLWVVSYDQAGNVSPAVPIRFLSSSSDGDISFVAGHGWSTANSSSPLSIIPDEQSPAGMIEPRLPLTLDTGPTKARLFTPTNETLQVITASGYTSLARTRNTSTGDHASVIEGTPAAGYQFEQNLGRFPALQASGTAPTNTKPLYLCVLAGSEGMTSASATCEGTGVTGTAVGYVWTVAPSGSVPLYRCRSGNDHFDSLDATCNGQIVEQTLGYVMPIRYNRTADPTPDSGLDPAVNTNYSFSVSAWINFNPAQTDLAPRNFTALSQNGAAHSDYFLQVDSNRKWRFCVRSQLSGIRDCAVSSVSATNNQWVFVTGIWDKVNRQVRLVISNTSVSTTALTPHIPTGDEPTSGAFIVGSSQASSAYVNNWNGYILRPTAFNGVISQPQLQALAALAPPQ